MEIIMKKIAVITGASSGMGRDFVKMIDKIEDCAEIWVIARRVDKLKELESETEKKILPIEMDLSKEVSYELYKKMLADLDLGLENRLSSKVGLLSGGQRQAVTLLMATIKQPKLLLLDEHTAALDPKTAAKVLEITERIVKENNLTTVMITHNMRDAIRYGNRLIMMHEGKIIVDVSGEEKQKLTVEMLLGLFSKASGGNEFSNDRAILA